MMLSQYAINEGTRLERDTRELAEFEELIARINYFIIRMSGSYAAAVELLRKHSIESRLDIEELELAGNPIDLLSDIMLLGCYISSLREEIEPKTQEKAQ